MREYGTVKTAFWTDPKIMALPDDAKFLALYLLTSPHTNALGCFRVPGQYIAADMGKAVKWVRDTMAVLIEAGWAEWHEETGWIWIRNYLRHNPPANGNVAKKCWREYEQIPADIPFRHSVWNGLKTVSRRFGNQPETPEPEPEPYPEPEPSPPYIPPADAGGKRVRRREPDYTPDFESFWQAYPRRKGKRAALSAYLKATDRAPPEQIRAGAQRFADECADTEPRFIPHPATWLNQDRWKDEPDHDRTRTIDADRIEEIINGRDPDAGYEAGEHVWPALEQGRDAGTD